MSFTGCRVGESLAAVPTAERLLSSVNTHVSLKITSVGEFLPTGLKKKGSMMEKQPQCKTVQIQLNTETYEQRYFQTCPVWGVCSVTGSVSP